MYRFHSFFKAWRLFSISLACVGAGHVHAQFAPASILTSESFQPLIANPLEARIGSVVQPANKHLRLDIGGRVALWHVPTDSLSAWNTVVGTEFATWTRLRSEHNLKFPVETVDYWFGLYATTAIPHSPLSLRMRVAHISSHLVDGLADSTATLSRKQFVYSREFVEALLAYTTSMSAVSSIRFYGGFTYVFSKQPVVTNPVVPQAGVEIDVPLGSNLSWLTGYDLKLSGYSSTYSAQHSSQTGIMLKTSASTGIMAAIYARSGDDMHGMYYNAKDEYIGFGFQVLW